MFLQGRTGEASTGGVGTSSSSDDLAGSDELSDEEYDLMCHREDRPCIFAPKTICVISRFPIYGVLRRFLRHLYAISLSRSGVPLERYISMFVSCIPMPPPGGFLLVHPEQSRSLLVWTAVGVCVTCGLVRRLSSPACVQAFFLSSWLPGSFTQDVLTPLRPVYSDRSTRTDRVPYQN